MYEGRSLAHFTIHDQIGAGGMGAVWRARDTRLNRDVALKILPEAFADDTERMARFQREAQALAALQHPNIASIYGIEQVDGVTFLVMELCEGEDLSSLVGRGPLGIPEVRDIAAQIARGLEEAHEKGIIHRDLKPANVKVSPEGRVKILDFGLARTLDDAQPDTDISGETLTAAVSMTRPGVVLGTAAYMSPEQARGKAVDKRTDIWAFGVILYEMVTGRRLFEGETVSDVLASVLRQDPDFDALPTDLPLEMAWLLRRCLDRNRESRLRDIGEARCLVSDDASASSLSLLAQPAPAGPEAATGGRRRRGWPVLALAVLAGAAVVAAAWLLVSPGPEATAPSFSPARKVTFTGDVTDPGVFWGSQPAGVDLAADGRTVVYMTQDRSRAMLVDLDGGGSQTLFTADTGVSLYDVAWSPDGGRVHLMTWPYSERVLSIPRLGGEPRQELDLRSLAGLNGIFVRPLADDRWLVVGDHNTLYIGQDPASLEARGTLLHGEGVFRIEGLELLGRIALSSDARWIAFGGFDTGGRVRCGVADATGRNEPVDAWTGLGPVAWANGDRTLFLWRQTSSGTGDLYRVEMDPRSGRPVSDPQIIYPGLAARSVHLSADGRRLVLRSGDSVSNLHEITLDGTTAADDNPARIRTRGTGRWFIHDVLSDGTMLASMVDDLGWELYAISDDDVHRSLMRRKELSRNVRSSPDEATIAIPVDEPAPAVLLYNVVDNRSRSIPVPEPLSSVSWSRDGAHLVAMTKNSADRMVVVDVGTGEARTLALDCGDKCQFAYEGVRTGPEWPYVAVTSEVDTWVVNVETGELRHVATDTWTILGWEGSWIYFMRGSAQTDWPGYVLFRVPADGGPEERLLDLPLNALGYELDIAKRTLHWVADESRLDLRLVEVLPEPER